MKISYHIALDAVANGSAVQAEEKPMCQARGGRGVSHTWEGSNMAAPA